MTNATLLILALACALVGFAVGYLIRRTLAEAKVHVGCLSVGVARAAYEHALAYAHERKQGGQAIVRHQSVKYRLFHMFRKVEAARALVRRAADYNATASQPALQGSIASKVTATQTAFEVASDALQLFGGNGLPREYAMEKLLRDARACLIADGCNEVLAVKGGSLLADPARIGRRKHPQMKIRMPGQGPDRSNRQ